MQTITHLGLRSPFGRMRIPHLLALFALTASFGTTWTMPHGLADETKRAQSSAIQLPPHVPGQAHPVIVLQGIESARTGGDKSADKAKTVVVSTVNVQQQPKVVQAQPAQVRAQRIIVQGKPSDGDASKQMKFEIKVDGAGKVHHGEGPHGIIVLNTDEKGQLHHDHASADPHKNIQVDVDVRKTGDGEKQVIEIRKGHAQGDNKSTGSAKSTIERRVRVRAEGQDSPPIRRPAPPRAGRGPRTGHVYDGLPRRGPPGMSRPSFMFVPGHRDDDDDDDDEDEDDELEELEELLESSYVRKLLSLMEENMELRSELRIQEAETELKIQSVEMKLEALEKAAHHAESHAEHQVGEAREHHEQLEHHVRDLEEALERSHREMDELRETATRARQEAAIQRERTERELAESRRAFEQARGHHPEEQHRELEEMQERLRHAHQALENREREMAGRAEAIERESGNRIRGLERENQELREVIEKLERQLHATKSEFDAFRKHMQAEHDHDHHPAHEDHAAAVHMDAEMKKAMVAMKARIADAMKNSPALEAHLKDAKLANEKSEAVIGQLHKQIKELHAQLEMAHAEVAKREAVQRVAQQRQAADRAARSERESESGKGTNRDRKENAKRKKSRSESEEL